MQRIMIIGASGSGKSTLARALGTALDLPVVHGDHFFFDAGWVQKPSEETMRLFCEAAGAPTWVFDGNHSASMEVRAERADVIIYLHLNKWHRLLRTLWRSLRYYGRRRPDMAEACSERFDLTFHIDWVLGHDKRSKPKMDWFAEQWQDQKPVLRFSSARKINVFLQNPQAYVAQHMKDMRA